MSVYIPLTSPIPLFLTILHLEWYICYNWRAIIDTVLLTEIHIDSRINAWCCNSVTLERCIMTCIHRYSVTQINYFIALNIT